MRGLVAALQMMIAQWAATIQRERAYRARKREVDNWVEDIRGQFYRTHLDLWDGHRPE